jgi:predicted nucleic acid-binding protein
LDRSRPLIFDTSVYIAAIRGGARSSYSIELEEALPRTYLCAVVAAELRAGAVDAVARRAVDRFTLAARAVRRTVVPGANTWERAGEVVSRIHRAQPELRSKLRTLWNDLLIGLSAREIGAGLVTCDVADFELLRRYTSFELSTLE